MLRADAASETVLPFPAGSPPGAVCVRAGGQGRSRVTVRLEGPGQFMPRSSIETAYPMALIEHILQVKGPYYLCDEIARDEDPTYTQATLEPDIFAYVSEEEFAGRTLLDFGCGSGASTAILGRKLPQTRILGVELNETLLGIARERLAFYHLEGVQLLTSPSREELPPGLEGVDFVVMSAVYEHLLPRDRETVLPRLWKLLRPGGVLFLDQTPHRYFPIEPHTTYLPFINYLPDAMAHAYARSLSILARSDPARPRLLEPCRLGARDLIDVWYLGSTLHSYPRGRRAVRWAAKVLQALTGICLVPYLALAIRKEV
ncbi:MAG: class I SAM-dependent methyltransferase [Candidatus Wallbacteria bacterium]|nr:class I SAM-dependent methyltransferase [Candidatus Wallbacteria bacterium]